MKHEELIARIPLFADLTSEDIQELESKTKECEFKSGERIVTVGQPGNQLFMILEGVVQVLYPARSQEFELARLGPGDFFGEMALLNDEPRSATVRALDPTRTLVLSKEDFREIVRTSTDLSLKLLRVLSERIRNADEQLSGLSEQALRDPLTGLLNRRAFNERIAEEANRALRYGDQFSLILMDLDHFTAVNDNLGHDAGDDLLRWIGRIMIEHTRAADSPFRIGGEEFAILAPAASPDVARSVAERIRSVVGEAKPPGDHDLQVTLSAGYASSPLHGTSAEQLYRIADQALHRAKEAGKNRVGDPARGDEAPDAVAS